MPMIIFIVAIAALALGGAMYYKNVSEVTDTTAETTTNEPATSGIADMLNDAQNAADAMEQGMGGAMPSEVTPEAPLPINSANEATSVYADGAYTQSGTYTSPAGEETVTISITLADDVIASATFSGDATNPGSINNQAKFAAGYSDLVVGKNIDEVALTVVNGSSLTGIGFMEALEAIKDEARL